MIESCDALVVGGGPAGSTCAWKLRQAGLEVTVVDSAVFPRDKVCAGWITPQVVTELALDVDEYRRGRTFQPIDAFRVGVIDGSGVTKTVYGQPVSFGIRRCEFDHYLLQRSGARVESATRVTSLRRADGRWIVNESMSTPLLVGAGGQFCPVARSMNGAWSAAALVVAQEAEFPIERRDIGTLSIEGESPELYFCRDLKGYGWCFRKGDYLNVGLGRLDRQSLPKATSEFLAFLTATGRLTSDTRPVWRGHAYSVYDSRRRVMDDGVMLAGDAAGLAYPQSGEGIRPAIESGLLAAAAVIAAGGRYDLDRLQPYERQLRARFRAVPAAASLSALVPDGFAALVARPLLQVPAFVRHVVLDRWFLHRREPALAS